MGAAVVGDVAIATYVNVGVVAAKVKFVIARNETFAD